MAQLPTAADLGPAPRVTVYRPAQVGGYDISGYAAGGQAMARGAEQLGRGIEQAGVDAGEIAQNQASFEYAQAHSEFLTAKVDLDNSVAKATSPGPDPADATSKSLPNRYADGIWAQRDAAAAKISDPRMRERFLAEVAPTVERGIVDANNHAVGLQNNSDLAYVQSQGDATINKAVGSSDDQTRMQLLDAHNRLIDGLQAKGAVTPERALAMKQEWAHQYATADILARSQSDPQGVINELQAKPGSPDQIVNRIIQNESGGDAHARATTSSAYGAAQFLASRPGGDTTWADLVHKYRPELAAGRSLDDINALRADPNLSREMLGHLIETNRGILQSNGVEPTPGALYLSHFLGPKSAVAVLKADPGKPVLDVLTAAVGPDMAAKMVAANQSVLGGRLAGSVTQWADGKMGGATPGTGSIYDILRPDVRESLLAHAQGLANKQEIEGRAGVEQRERDTAAEAMNEGVAKNPVSQEEFIGAYGADQGRQRFESYQGNLRLAADLKRVAAMSPQDQAALLDSYTPQSGEGYAASAQRQAELAKAIAQRQAELKADPAGYAIRNLPATGEAFGKLQATLSNPTAGDDERAAAARDFATKTRLEQEHVGVPQDAQRLLPKTYVDQFNKEIAAAAESDDPQKRIGLVARIQQEGRTWGDAWPQVMRQLSPTAQPIVRAIAAGADPAAMTRLLALPKDMTAGKILGEGDENGPKLKDVNSEVSKAMAPLMRTLVGNQKERDYPVWFGLAQKLAALDARDGKSASDAAQSAFAALIGNRYEFRDSYRIPKSAGVNADDVQAGALMVRRPDALAGLGAQPLPDPLAGAQPFENDLPGRSPESTARDMRDIARDGVFVTAPDGSGLNLVYNTKRLGPVTIKGSDGKPILLPWADLAARGRYVTAVGPTSEPGGGL